MKKKNEKIIKLPKSYIDFIKQEEMFERALGRLLNITYTIEDEVDAMKEIIQEEIFIKKRVYPSDSAMETLENIRKNYKISIQDICCVAIYRYKKSFPGRLDVYR